MAATTASSSKQVKLQLTTNDTSLELPESTGPILVNTSLRRIDLSRLVNHLRDATQPPLEFIVNGQFLRTSIDEFLTANGLSSESLLTVEYIRATIPPVHVASYQHDDWVSAVDVLSNSSPSSVGVASSLLPKPGHERILSGSLDGHIRVWDTSNQVLATSGANESAVQGYRGVKSTRWLSSTQIVSGGYDQVVRIWNYSDSDDEGSASIKPYLELYGHRHAVLSVAGNAATQRAISASADGSVCVWSTKRSNAPEADEKLIPRSTKRQKLASTAPSGAQSIQTAQRGPLHTLKGHSDQATAVAFHPDDATAAYSGSWDRTMRTWDLVTGVLVDTRSLSTSAGGNGAVSALCPLRLSSSNLVACGTMGRGANIVLVDPRIGASATVAMSLKGHTNPVSALACDPDSEYRLVSGGYDSTCRIWDVRNAKASDKGTVSESVYTIQRESAASDAKVLDVCWDKNVGIVAGGEDTRVQINKGEI